MKRMKQATLFNYDYTSREAGPSDIEVQDCQVSESESQPILSGELSEPCCEHENRPITFEHSLLEVAITRSRPLADTEMYTLLTTMQDDIPDDELDTRSFTFGGGQKRKHITFQRRWLKEYVWLRYGKSGNDRGGWCLPCVLFLTASESASLHLSIFINSPFVNYNKSKEILDSTLQKSTIHMPLIEHIISELILLIQSEGLIAGLQMLTKNISNLILKFYLQLSML